MEGAAALDLEEAQVAVVLQEEDQEVLVAPVPVELPWVEVHFLAEDRCMRPEAEVDLVLALVVEVDHVEVAVSS